MTDQSREVENHVLPVLSPSGRKGKFGGAKLKMTGQRKLLKRLARAAICRVQLDNAIIVNYTYNMLEKRYPQYTQLMAAKLKASWVSNKQKEHELDDLQAREALCSTYNTRRKGIRKTQPNDAKEKFDTDMMVGEFGFVGIVTILCTLSRRVSLPLLLTTRSPSHWYSSGVCVCVYVCSCFTRAIVVLIKDSHANYASKVRIVPGLSCFVLGVTLCDIVFDP